MEGVEGRVADPVRCVGGDLEAHLVVEAPDPFLEGFFHVALEDFKIEGADRLRLSRVGPAASLGAVLHADARGVAFEGEPGDVLPRVRHEDQRKPWALLYKEGPDAPGAGFLRVRREGLEIALVGGVPEAPLRWEEETAILGDYRVYRDILELDWLLGAVFRVVAESDAKPEPVLPA